MILITGATGNLGSSVVHYLESLISHNEFAVLARNLEKAKIFSENNIKVRYGDFNDINSLQNAFIGIEKLVLISTMEMNRLAQHKTVIDVAKQAGVKHVIYTSLAIQDINTSAVKELMESHFETENYLKSSGLNFTILRNTIYAEAIPQIIGEQALDTGILLSGGLGKVPYALRDEMGEAIANLLVQSGHKNKIYNITGSTFYNYQDIAEMLSDISGKKVNYHALENDEYVTLLENLGLPKFLIFLTSGTVLDIKNDQYEIESSDLEKLLGRKTASLKNYLTQFYQ
ncbi:SDR family oxidoreductase [Acinetobacter sp. ANC 3832]|uniref:SDR family oxidoreductase n=1 Tax=Acinetobacter sp. ANC 3832 TaxID=1977874 RepID=UPI000A349DC1|nr:SDR family oxidoreductase [Acinetobacter sp. ANC 3832]OTG94978.1 hypothetical protein B9T35_06350 [Acinetobacter sp. ANC 3832]